MLGLGIVAAAAQRSQQQPAQSAVEVHGLVLMAPGCVPDHPYPNPNPRTLALALALTLEPYPNPNPAPHQVRALLQATLNPRPLTLAPTPTLPLTRYVPRYKPLPLFYLPARLLSWIQPQLDAGFEARYLVITPSSRSSTPASRWLGLGLGLGWLGLGLGLGCSSTPASRTSHCTLT